MFYLILLRWDLPLSTSLGTCWLTLSLLPGRVHPFFFSNPIWFFCISWLLSWENKSHLRSVRATAEGGLAGRGLAGFQAQIVRTEMQRCGLQWLLAPPCFLSSAYTLLARARTHTYKHTHTHMHVPFLASCPASPSLSTAVFLISRRYILLGANPPFLCAFLTSYLMHGSLVSLEMRRHKGEADIRGLTAIMAVYKPNPSRLVDTSIFVPLKRYK